VKAYQNTKCYYFRTQKIKSSYFVIEIVNVGIFSRSDLLAR